MTADPLTYLLTASCFPKDDGLGGDDVAEEDSCQQAAAPPTPLFKLTPGMTANSHGIACAQVAGEGLAAQLWLFESRNVHRSI